MNALPRNKILTFIKTLLKRISWQPWLLIAVGALMANISWLKWPDLVIDFGEQTYIAWRLSEGSILYKDIIYFYGPLSSYIHALLFKIFGPQLIALIIFNLSGCDIGRIPYRHSVELFNSQGESYKQYQLQSGNLEIIG